MCRKCAFAGRREKETAKKQLWGEMQGGIERAEKKERCKRTVESTWVLAWRGEGQFAVRCECFITGKRSPAATEFWMSYRQGWEERAREQTSVRRWRLVIEIRCLGSRADRKSREQTLLSRTVCNLHRYIVRERARRAPACLGRARRFAPLLVSNVIFSRTLMMFRYIISDDELCNVFIFTLNWISSWTNTFSLLSLW